MEYAEIDGDLLFVYYYSVWYFNKILCNFRFNENKYSNICFDE